MTLMTLIMIAKMLIMKMMLMMILIDHHLPPLKHCWTIMVALIKVVTLAVSLVDQKYGIVNITDSKLLKNP